MRTKVAINGFGRIGRLVFAALIGAYVLAEGIRSRVVSMPSWDLFDHQPQAYRDSVLPPP